MIPNNQPSHQNLIKNRLQYSQRFPSHQKTFQTADEMIKFMQLNYFYTIQTIYQTWNFDIALISSGSTPLSPPPTTMQQQFPQFSSTSSKSQTIYLPPVYLIGTLHKLQPLSLPPQASQPLSLIKTTYKTTYDTKIKYLLITSTSYKQNFVKSFNRMMKNKNGKYLFTNLQPLFYKYQHDWELYFLLTSTTYIIHITQQLYNLQFKPLQRIIDQDFHFSTINLSKIYTIDQLDRTCKDGFILAQIRQKFQTRQKQNIIIVGLVYILQKPKYINNTRGKKQMVLLLTQVLYRPTRQQLLDLDGLKSKYQQKLSCNSVGRCKIIIRYHSFDQQYVENIIQNNHVIVFSDIQILVTQTVNIFYLLNIPKNPQKTLSIFRITSTPFQGINFATDHQIRKPNNFSILDIQNLFGITLAITPLSKFLEKTIDRNLVKLALGFLQVQVIYGSIRCTKCNWQIKKKTTQQLLSIPQQQITDPQILKQHKCYSTHTQSHTLNLWGTIRAADSTASCLLSLDHKQLINYLQLYPYLTLFQQHIINNGKGLVLMNSNKQKFKSIHEHDPLFQVKNKIKKHFVQKIVVGFAKIQLDKTFRQGLNQEEKMDYQGSFHTTKKYLQQKKIFPNGIIEKKHQEILLLPFIKALEVFQPL